MTEELFVFEETDENDPDEEVWLQQEMENLKTTKSSIRANLDRLGLEGEYNITFDPISLTVEVTLSEYAIAYLLALAPPTG